MTNENWDGGPAFPVAEDHKIANDYPWTAGMNLRDWFAGMAMQGILSNKAVEDYRQQLGELGIPDHKQRRVIAQMSHEYADAMLAERRRRYYEEAEPPQTAEVENADE